MSVAGPYVLSQVSVKTGNQYFYLKLSCLLKRPDDLTFKSAMFRVTGG